MQFTPLEIALAIPASNDEKEKQIIQQEGLFPHGDTRVISLWGHKGYFPMGTQGLYSYGDTRVISLWGHQG